MFRARLFSRSAALATVAFVALGFVHPAAAAEAVTASGPAAEVRTETDALREAQVTGRPVEIPEQTTETRQVLANPNGTFTMRSNVRPVRVKRDGAWVPIDATLRRNPDGSLSPAATAQDVTFSGGGPAPLVTLRHSGKTLAFGWPGPLPAPAVSGDTATYPGVFPGVDLRITAQADSYLQVLVVHDAVAAANPALAQLRLTVTGTGLNLTVAPAGNLSATGPDGAEVFHGAPPTMWDSRLGDRVGPAPTATDPGSGQVTPLAVAATPRTTARNTSETSTTDLTISPDPAALIGPGVVYPLYIDPSMAVRKTHWTRVTDNGWAPHYDDPAAIAQVGYCGGWPDCGGFWRARSYFELDTTTLLPRNGRAAAIWRAQFYATQVWSADHNCGGGQPTDVWESSNIYPSTNWPGPANLVLDTQYSNAGGPCPANNLVFNVIASAQRATANGWVLLVLGLIAKNENDRNQWKKFDNNPLLEVDFNFPPNPATALRVSNEIRCDDTVVTPDARPTLHATATDNNNPPLQLGLGHEVWNKAQTTLRAATPDPPPDIINSGGTGAWQIPALGNGNYTFRTAVHNINPSDASKNLWNGGWSNWYPFTIDTTPPATAPTFTSADYPSDYWGPPSGAPGAIQVSTTVADVVGYTYTFTGSGTELVPNSSDCDYHRTFGTTGGWIPHAELGPDWIPIPAGLTPGRHTLHVKSFDKAHNLSPESAYTFYVAPNTGLSAQRFEAESLPRSQPAGQNIELAPVNDDCCDISWSGGAALDFWGDTTGQSFTLNFQTTAANTYRIAIGLTKSSGQGQLQLTIDGQAIGNQTPGQPPGTFDLYNTRLINTHHPLDNRTLAAGTHTLKVTMVELPPGSWRTPLCGSVGRGGLVVDRDCRPQELWRRRQL